LTDSSVEIRIAATNEELEAAFALRMAVFVEEQRVPPDEEMDGYDVIATHFVACLPVGTDAPGEVIATARLVDKGAGVGKIGRVAVAAAHRGRKVGAALMRHIHSQAAAQGCRQIVLEAQCYAIPFYEKLGYVAEGPVFLDANIEHRLMRLDLQPECDSRAAAGSEDVE